MKTTTAFPEPLHTQTPNNFFEMIPDMSDAELRVTLVMIRNTFGWHRDEFKMGINKLATAAGLSRNGAKDGADAAEKRGTFRRTNPDAQTEAEWELVVESSQLLTPSASDQGVGQPVTTPPSASDSQVGVKESKNKQLKNAPLDWKIVGNQPITEEDLQDEKLQREAPRMFEAAFGFGKLPWDSTREWEKMRKFVTEIYRQDRLAFGNYVVWRAGDGKFTAMSNKQIRQTPGIFIDTGWPEFANTSTPSRPQVDANAIEQTRRMLDEKEVKYVPPPAGLRPQINKLANQFSKRS